MLLRGRSLDKFMERRDINLRQLRNPLPAHFRKHSLQSISRVSNLIAQFVKLSLELARVEDRVAAWCLEDSFLVCQLKVLPLE
jgi:hypothetical protein